MRSSHYALLLGLALAVLGCRPGGDQAQAQGGEGTGPKAAEEPRDKSSMELVGTLRRPLSAKHAYRLEIYPAGNLQVLEMLGDDLKKLPDKTAVRVRGVVRSQIVGPAKGDPDQYPVQWGVWLRVSEVQSYTSVEEAFRDTRERQEREKGR